MFELERQTFGNRKRKALNNEMGTFFFGDCKILISAKKLWLDPSKFQAPLTFCSAVPKPEGLMLIREP